MATITSVGSGSWATAGTWDAGVPVDGDDVVIASGHTVTFDVDQSAFTTGVGITITGTLNHTTTTGTYCLFAKTGASIVGAGTWNIGTSATPIPFAAKHTITGAAGWYVDGNSGLIVTIYGEEPTNKYVRLSGAEALGQTELSVDTDVRSDRWTVGDTVAICNINKAQNAEIRTIAAGGIAESTITITSGLTAAKVTGTYIVLVSRNITILSNASARLFYRCTNMVIGGGSLQSEVNKSVLESCVNVSLSNGVIYFGSENIKSCSVVATGGVVVYSALGMRASGTESQSINMTGVSFIGCNYVTYGNSGYKFKNCLFAGNKTVFANPYTENIGGTFIGNLDVSTSRPINIIGGTYTDNNRIFYNNDYVTACDMTINNPTYFCRENVVGKMRNITINGGSEWHNYHLIRQPYEVCEIEDFGGTAGAYKEWGKGGIVVSQVSVLPSGYSSGFLLTPTNANYHIFLRRDVSIPAGESIGIEVNLRKDASMTYLPRVYLMKSNENPLLESTPVDTFTMTNSTNTWEAETFVVDNSAGTTNLNYTLWFVAKNASGSVYSAYDITTAGGTGGGLLTHPSMTGGMRG